MVLMLRACARFLICRGVASVFCGLAQTDSTGVLMAQRYMGFWNPFYFEFKRLACQAVGA